MSRPSRPISGYAAWSHPEQDRPFERDTVSCGHCGTIAFRKPRNAPLAQGTIPLVGVGVFVGRAQLLTKKHQEDMGGFCLGCMSFICLPCAEEGGCTPFEKRLDRMEKASRMLIAAGADPSKLDLKPEDFK